MKNAVLITAPTEEVISVAECKSLLGIAGSADDDLLKVLIGGVVENIDPARLGMAFGRSLRPAIWELRLPGFPGCNIELPFPPQTSVTSVKYDDSDGVEQTLVENTDFRVFRLSDVERKAYVAPIYGGSWPSARYDDESVRIRYVSGYAGAAMPQGIKAAVALGVRQVRSEMERNMYLASEDIPGVRAREWVVTDQARLAITAAMENLLSKYRVYG